MLTMLFSLSIVVFLASSVSALATPHGHGQYARDVSLAARHHHIARQANVHPLTRRSARRQRCLEKTPSFSPATVPTTSSDPPDVPVNVANQPPPKTPTPTPTTPYAPPQPTTTTSSTPPPANGGESETHSGDGTFFGVGLGACGQTSVDTDYMVAIGWQLFDSFATGASVGNPNLNPVCGRRIRASYGGNSVTVVALDRCGGCQPHDLDFSPTAFSQLASQDLGRLKNVEWQFI